jgi:hypothetical protein
LDVVDERAAPGEQARVLDPADPAACVPRRSDGEVSRLVHDVLLPTISWPCDAERVLSILVRPDGNRAMMRRPSGDDKRT